MNKQNQTVNIQKHIPELDGLRAIAVLSVIFAHCASMFVLPEQIVEQKIWHVLMSGWIGVELFFVLSGFLITGILIDTFFIENRLKKFYIRRSLRIFPLYYLLLTLCFIVFLFINSPVEISLGHSLLVFFYLGNLEELFNFPRYYILNHTWSLAVEEQFYLIWPILFLYSHKYGLSKYTCILGIIIVNASRIFLTVNPFETIHTPYILTICRTDALFSGALLSILIKQEARLLSKISAVNLANILFIAGILLFLFSFQYAQIFIPGDTVTFLIGLPSLSLLFSAFILYSTKLDSKHLFRSILKLKPLTYIGKISYGIYIYHWPIIIGLSINQYIFFDMNHFSYHILPFLSLTLLITIGIASISYYYIERPILNLKNRYASYP